MAYKIRIGGLSAVPSTPVESLLAKFGTILSTEPDEREPEVGGYEQATGLIVTFEDEESADRAVAEMNGFVMDGRALVITPLPLRPPPKLPPDPPLPTP